MYTRKTVVTAIVLMFSMLVAGIHSNYLNKNGKEKELPKICHDLVEYVENRKTDSWEGDWGKIYEDQCVVYFYQIVDEYEKEKYKHLGE